MIDKRKIEKIENYERRNIRSMKFFNALVRGELSALCVKLRNVISMVAHWTKRAFT